MAEGDRDAYRRQQAALAREKEIMKDVKGWVIDILRSISCFRSAFYPLLDIQPGSSVYNNPKYHSPEIVIL
ncbi:hypothetical protein PC9H_004817 [Pleurotus ostreatus]|uniref:Uncharacterized protein n=1 Tax=Pleurotus ostreatus TaxID=5322 RepID=A0A8H6ZZM5_PLEOS|nr:uncharacterized protein PC9H_004817 [Pleurotus ostreatus]KAF7432873.1 hypothetical protein PC9H_004817 [Pleurotus ostreatus]